MHPQWNLNFNPVSVVFAPLLVSVHCTEHTFLQGDGLADSGLEQGVSSDQLKGLRECERKLIFRCVAN